ncbi:MAG: DUF2911 domain-containing protein, partial [Janthinobacterium lividum]
MKKLMLAVALSMPCMFALQMNAQPGRGADLPSPGHKAEVTIGAAKMSVDYGAPSLKGRKALGGELMPYDTWWRTGANEATTFETTNDVMVGNLKVPAGKYTLVTYPSTGTWQLVICKATGQWGTERKESEDLGKVPMMKATLPAPQETMSIDFEKTGGKRTQMHIKWENTD